jgi:hypothetical protein
MSAKTKPDCKFCGKPADLMDYREVDTITSKVPSCNSCKNLSTEFLYSTPEEKIEMLRKQLKWFNDFADCVQHNHRVYDNACEHADELEIERNPEEDEEE